MSLRAACVKSRELESVLKYKLAKPYIQVLMLTNQTLETVARLYTRHQRRKPHKSLDVKDELLS